MFRLAVLSAALVIVGTAAGAQEKSDTAIQCETAAYNKYKADLNLLSGKVGSRPMTVEEVKANLVLTNVYCLKKATCHGGPSAADFGARYQICLKAEAEQTGRGLDKAADPR